MHFELSLDPVVGLSTFFTISLSKVPRQYMIVDTVSNRHARPHFLLRSIPAGPLLCFVLSHVNSLNPSILRIYNIYKVGLLV